MRSAAVVCFLLVSVAGCPGAWAEGCPGNPDALGTSRTIIVDPLDHVEIGTMQYQETLPLADKEVVLTFDDGPLPPSSRRILDTLAAQCVKATYFMVGSMARAFPALAREIYNAGHTVGTHTEDHPLHLDKMPAERVDREIDDGIASVAAALGDPKALSPFFRVPGLARSPVVERAALDRNLMIWSADFPADDWKHISANEIIKRALTRLDAKGKGVLLLHDIHPVTAQALPELLRQLKLRGYKVVQVVPADADRPKTVTEPEQWVLNHGRTGSPRVDVNAAVTPTSPILQLPAGLQVDSSEGVEAFGPTVPALLAHLRKIRMAALWPRAGAETLSSAEPTTAYVPAFRRRAKFRAVPKDRAARLSFATKLGLRGATD